MSVRSVFEFKFPEKAQPEGLAVCQAIGKDMTEKSGYVQHEVLQDTKDAGHIIVSTL